MSYIFLALLGSACFAFNSITQRRAVIQVTDAAAGVLITVPFALFFYLIILLLRGEIGSVADFTWQSYLWFALAGLSNYVFGRQLRYHLVQLAGANISNIMTTTSPLFSVTLGILWLGEGVSWKLVIGVALIASGLIITGLNPRMRYGGKSLLAGVPPRAYLLGIGTGLGWGLAPIFIKLGLGDSGSSVAAAPIAGAFIAHGVATIFLGPLLFRKGKRDTLTTMKRNALGFFLLSGLFTGVAQLFRYYALSVGPASVVAPVFATSPIFALFLAFIFNRKLEMFSVSVIVGTIVVIIGAVLLTT